MSLLLRVLILEDNHTDAELMVNELKRANFDPHADIVDNEADYLAKLGGGHDVILSDFRMPQFDASQALQLLHEKQLDIPFIIVSGTIGEEQAVAVMQQGADDYVMKDRMARLGPAVAGALEKKRLRTRQKYIAEALRESEERYRLLFENAPIPMWIYDYDTLRYRDINEAAIQRYGYSRDEFLSMTILDMHPQGERFRLMKLLAGKPSGNLGIWRHHRKDGSYMEVEIVSNLVTIGGRQVRFGLCHDVTERKQAEQQILEQANLIDLANDAIMSWDMDERVRFWNQRAESLYGWSPNEAVGRSIKELISPEPAVFEEARKYLFEHGSWSGELAQTSHLGRKLIADTRWTLLRDEYGVPKSVLAINTDITEKKKLEEQFLRGQRLESIGTLASGVAHDLNNILSPIMMSAAMLRQPLSPETQESIVTTIEESAQRGSDIVKQVLTFARGVQGEHVPLQPRHLIREIEKIASETFPKSISVINDTTRDLHMISGDPTQIHQVLLNLCINARDAMPQGGELVLSAENRVLHEKPALHPDQSRPGDYVVLSVRDTGAGIPHEIIDKIFDPFFTTKESGKGTGLGLSTVIGIVKSHRGFVTVESECGKGSRFNVFIPACAEDDPACGKKQEPAGNNPTGNGEIILVVDDEAEIRKVLEAILTRHGYKVIVASDGNEALKNYIFQAGAVKLVLTDVMMPWVDGVVLSRALKKIDPHARIIASTGQQEQSRLDELRTLGVTTFLKKPYNGKNLLLTVDAALHGREIPGETPSA